MKKLSTKYQGTYQGVNFIFEYNEVNSNRCKIWIEVDLRRVPTIMNPSQILQDVNLNQIFDGHSKYKVSTENTVTVSCRVLGRSFENLKKLTHSHIDRLTRLCKYESLCVGSNKFHPTDTGFYLGDHFFNTEWTKSNPRLYKHLVNHIGK